MASRPRNPTAADRKSDGCPRQTSSQLGRRLTVLCLNQAPSALRRRSTSRERRGRPPSCGRAASRGSRGRGQAWPGGRRVPGAAGRPLAQERAGRPAGAADALRCAGTWRRSSSAPGSASRTAPPAPSRRPGCWRATPLCESSMEVRAGARERWPTEEGREGGPSHCTTGEAERGREGHRSQRGQAHGSPQSQRCPWVCLPESRLKPGPATAPRTAGHSAHYPL